MAIQKLDITYVYNSGTTYGHFDAADIVEDTFALLATHKSMLFDGEIAIVNNGNNPVEFIKIGNDQKPSGWLIKTLPVFSTYEELIETSNSICTNLIVKLPKTPTKAFRVGMEASAGDKRYKITKIEQTSGATGTTLTWEEVTYGGGSSKIEDKDAEEVIDIIGSGASATGIAFHSTETVYKDANGTWTDTKPTEGDYEEYEPSIYSTVIEGGEVKLLNMVCDKSIDCGTWGE